MSRFALSSKILPISFGVIVILLALFGFGYWMGNRGPQTPTAETSPTVSASPNADATSGLTFSPDASPTVDAPPGSPVPGPGGVDLAVDASGLSKATAVITTPKGVIRFKFYPQDAPNTVTRFIELIQKGFYNGLTFHRIEPGFVVQGGDPLGTGKGGSGQKLKAEFNERRHVEGTVAMARARDPDSADSQFYMTLSTQPHLDRNYTVFGQVIEGMDVVRKLQAGDKMTSVKIE